MHGNSGVGMSVNQKVAIFGTGKIGADLLAKIVRSTGVECVAFIGRRVDSPGVQFANSKKVPVFFNGISEIEKFKDSIDWVIDATSAKSHIATMPRLAELGLNVIDMTPSGLGDPFSPLVDTELVSRKGNYHVNLMTCGAQVSVPFVHTIGSIAEIEYIESIANLSSESVGPATRINIDEYTSTTEKALALYSGAKRVKAIMIINPAIPPIPMKVTLFARFAGAGPSQLMRSKIAENLNQTLENFRKIVPGMSFPHAPYFEENYLKVDIQVMGSGDFVPTHSGNLDVLTSTALWLIRQSTKDR